MKEFGIAKERVYANKQSGEDFNRPAYNKLMAQLGSGDVLVIKSLDRLGRNYDEMLKQLEIITREKNAAIVVLDLPLLDTRQKNADDLTAKLISNLVIQVFSYVAETERHMNHQRTMEGLAAAKRRGVRLGRRPVEKPAHFAFVRDAWAAGKISEREAAARLGVSRPTFHKWTHE
jgi:DNA invertase Pin-like site-specific DNA recombinase